MPVWNSGLGVGTLASSLVVLILVPVGFVILEELADLNA